MIVLRMLGFTFALLTVAPIAHAQQDDAAVAQARMLMDTRLKDAESARFRDVIQVTGTGKTHIVCGWVNAKNSFGGYIGFKPFFATGKSVDVRDWDSVGTFKDSMFRIMWETCRPPTGESFGAEPVQLPKINIKKQCAKLRKYVPDNTTCEQSEVDARAWLLAHPTAGWISLKCARKARESQSYASTKSCVQDSEADVVFRRGPSIP